MHVLGGWGVRLRSEGGADTIDPELVALAESPVAAFGKVVERKK
jgi:hypothetical protein